MATITFGILTALFLKEVPSLKIWISLLLALAIVILNTSNALDKV
jgi:drug/metabolite transporter (DMT)-like permease